VSNRIGALKTSRLLFPQRFAIMGMDGKIDKLVGVLNTIFKQYAQGLPRRTR